MKLGVFSLMQWPEDRTQSEVYHDELDRLVAAEEQGYDAVWLAEHHSSRYGIGPSIHLSAAHLAARTERVRIGTAVTILPAFHPLRVAEEVATLDIMSNGRFDWGVGRGDQGRDSSALDVDISASHEVFCEQLEIVLRAWTGERFSHEGELFRFPELECLPTPVQQPRPPIWIAAHSPTTFDWAAENHYPVLTDPFSPWHRIEKQRLRYRERAAQAGFDTSELEFPTLRHVYVGETMKRAREAAAPALLRSYRALSPGGASGEVPESRAFSRLFGDDEWSSDRDPESFVEYLFENCSIVGDAAYCREKLAELRERIGLDSLIAWQDFGNLPPDLALASQRRLIEL